MAMYDGNWKCSGCGGAITQLPFQPRSESGLTCRDCYGKNKESEVADQPVPEMQTADEPMPMDGIPDFDESQIGGEQMPADDAFAGLETAAPAAPGEKPKTEGNWSCSGCSAAITSLPFTPRNTDNLKCLDCFKASK
jgi:CxxC-x17-CxxC domain-containing protein